MEKICSKCGIPKPLGEYHQNYGGKFNLSSQCRFCKNEYKKEYNKNNKENSIRKKINTSLFGVDY